jgi:hypothetical protein
VSRTDERRPGGTERRSQKAAGQVASAVQSNGRRAESAPMTFAALSAALRDYGIQADENTDACWRSCCDRAIDYLAAVGEPFRANHVQALIPAADHPHCRIGARFHAASNAGVIRPVGYVLSERPSRHRGVQRLYRGGAAG